MNEQKVDRLKFAEQLQKVIEQVHDESQSIVDRLPALKASFEEDEGTLGGFVKDLLHRFDDYKKQTINLQEEL